MKARTAESTDGRKHGRQKIRTAKPRGVRYGISCIQEFRGIFSRAGQARGASCAPERALREGLTSALIQDGSRRLSVLNRFIPSSVRVSFLRKYVQPPYTEKQIVINLSESFLCRACRHLRHEAGKPRIADRLHGKTHGRGQPYGGRNHFVLRAEVCRKVVSRFFQATFPIRDRNRFCLPRGCSGYL